MSRASQKRGNITLTDDKDDGQNGKHESNCTKCNHNDSWDNMVQCDVCNVWQHYECAGVDSFIQNISWMCQVCANLLQKQESVKNGSVSNSMTPCTGCKRDVKISDAFNDPISKQILCAGCYKQFYPVLSQLSRGDLAEQCICQRCGEPILNGRSVTCKTCKFGFHDLCAGLLDEASGGDLLHWKCDVCKTGRRIINQLSNVSLSMKSISKNQHGNTGEATSGTTISSNRRREEMKRIEEERVLAIQRLQEAQEKRRKREEEEALVLKQIDKIYIDSKYDLSSKSSTSRSSKRSVSSNTVHEQRVQQWLQHQRVSNSRLNQTNEVPNQGNRLTSKGAIPKSLPLTSSIVCSPQKQRNTMSSTLLKGPQESNKFSSTLLQKPIVHFEKTVSEPMYNSIGDNIIKSKSATKFETDVSTILPNLSRCSNRLGKLPSATVSNVRNNRSTNDVLQCNETFTREYQKPIIQSNIIKQPRQLSGIHNLNQQDSSARQHFNSTSQLRSQSVNNRLNTQHLATKDRLTQAEISARQALSLKCALPKFNGNPLDWPLFYSNYANSTTMCGFSNAENLGRLQDCLQGVAREQVSDLLMRPELVPEIMNVLYWFHGRPELIINKLLDKIKELPNVKIDKLNTLIDLSLKIKNLCAVIQSAEMNSHLNNPTLLREIVGKLPASLKLEWAKFKFQLIEEVNLSHISQWLFSYGAAAVDVNYEPTHHKNEVKSQSHSKSSPKFTQASHQIEKDDHEKPQQGANNKCVMCDNLHELDNCSKFKQLNRSDKYDVIKKNNLCRNCFGTHYTLRCKSKTRCSINNCGKRHHKYLHNPNYTPTNDESSSQSKAKNSTSDSNIASKPIESKTESNVSNSTFLGRSDIQQSSHKTSTIFKIVPVTLYGPQGCVKAHAFLDDGSSVTLINKKLAMELGLEGPHELLHLKWTGKTSRTEKSQRVEVKISGQNSNNDVFILRNVRTVDDLNLPRQSCNVNDIKQQYPYLQNIDIQGYTDIIPEILIGINHWQLGIPLQTREGRWNQPVATLTRLGWIVFGGSTHESSRIASLNVHELSDNSLNDIVKEFISMDQQGVRIPERKFESNDEVTAQRILSEAKLLENGHFECGLLWKNDVSIFPDTKPLAMKRLLSLERQMNKNEDVSKNIKKQIREYLDKGYIYRLNECQQRII